MQQRLDGYIFVARTDTLRVAVENPSGAPIEHPVEVFADPAPTVLGGRDLGATRSFELTGAGDTLVLAVADERTVTWSVDATGACLLGVWGPKFDALLDSDAAVWALEVRCHAPETYSNLLFVGTVVPYVLFARNEPVTATIALTH